MTRFRSSEERLAEGERNGPVDRFERRTPRAEASGHGAKARFKIVVAALSVALSACATSSGAPLSRIPQPDIAAAYWPLHGRVHLGLDSADGAAVVIAPGIAATNGHNRRLLGGAPVIGEARDYDLLFFRVTKNLQPPTAPVQVGAPVIAYGQGADAELRIAHGIVREIVNCTGCDQSAYFIFEGNAGPGFSGGPVVDAEGRLLGITFGYKDEGGKRLIYAYEMARVRAELQALPGAAR
jgi:hypothetical protein